MMPEVQWSRCLRCGRVLKAEASKGREFGPECLALIEQGVAATKRQQASQLVAGLIGWVAENEGDARALSLEAVCDSAHRRLESGRPISRALVRRLAYWHGELCTS